MKQSKDTIEKNIKNTILLSSTIITLIVATIIGVVLIKSEYSNFKIHIKSFRDTLIELEMFSAKTSALNLKNDIQFEKLSILNNKKAKVKNQSIIAYNLAKHLYSQTKNLSNKERIEIIKSSLKKISQKENDINYFILDKSGKFLLDTSDETNEKVNFLDFEDINGVKFVNNMINFDHHKQNYIEYFWYKPYKRITYSRYLEDLGLIIGSSSFLESSKEVLKKKLLRKISLQNFNNEEFLYIYKINSLNEISSKSTLLLERNIRTNKEDLNAMKELMIKSNYKANQHIFYKNSQRLIYGTYLKDLRFFIGIGIKLFHINAIVENEKRISLDNMYSKIINLVIIISIISVIFFIFSLYFTKKIENLFNLYRNRVKENEEKYALLFNHSNDGFIISGIYEDTTSILSLNNTALKVTGDDIENVLYKDFFSFFEDITLKEILESKSIYKTVKFISKNNEKKTIELNATIYMYEDQNLLFASLRDITERTKLKVEKERQNQILIQKSKMAAMGEMIGNIAHQWRQPLAQISGLFFDIESAYDYKELNKKYLSKNINEANDILEYMSKTIDDFRNFFNPDSKEEEFSILSAVSSAMGILNSSLKYYNIEVEINCDEKFKINGYKNEYSQVIVNIVSNAKDVLLERDIKNPKIRIFIENKNEKPSLFIEDNAGGINSEILEKIFDPYFTTKREYGTGIGLYMTKLIIEEKMNGIINAKNSENGAIFSISV